MKISWKNIILTVFCVLFMGNISLCSEKINKNLYIMQNQQIKTVSDTINTYISDKNYYRYRTDIENGFYYFKPKYMGIYNDNNYIVVNIKQVKADVYVYIQNNSGAERMKQLLQNNLKKHNFKQTPIKDPKVIENYAKQTDMQIGDFSNKNENQSPTNILPNPLPNAQNATSNSTAKKPAQASISKFREISKAGQIFKEVNNSVVTVMSTGHGSGFLVDLAGLIITNYHVVKEHTDDLRVRFGKGEIVSAKVVETDPENDVAILWVNLQNIKNFSILKIFNPTDNEPLVMVGEKVIAIGSPIQWETYEKTMTEGVVGKFDGKIIMHDASINHGNSGGPLINFGGYAVGINTFGPSNTDNNSLGGSISITQALPALDKAKANIKSLAQPSATLLSDISTIPYSYDIMKNTYYKYSDNAATINERMKPYVIKSQYYNIAIVTPPQNYRKMAYEDAQTLKRHQSRLRKSGETVDNEEYESKTQANYEYIKPVVSIIVAPRPFLTPGSATMLTLLALSEGMASAYGSYCYHPIYGHYSYEFKKDFDKLQLINSNTAQQYQTVSSGKEPITKEEIGYFNYGNFDLIDKSYVGYYEYDAKTFANLDKLVLNVFSKDKHSPIKVEVPQKIKNYIMEDFQPYWSYVNSKH